MHRFLICLLVSATFVMAQDETAKVEEELVVTATKQERKLEELPVSATVVDREELTIRGAAIPGDELVGIPGVFFRRTEAADSFMTINFRGLTGVHGNDTFLALVDGIPFVSAHEEVLLGEVPYGAVDRVEVVRGPASALYGRGALSGAVNYITRSPRAERDIDVSLTGGSFGHIAPHVTANLPVGDGVHHFLIDAQFLSSDGWRDRTDRESGHILIKNEMIFSDTFTLSAFVNVHQNEQGAGGQIPIGEDGSVLPTAGGRTGFIGYEPNRYDRETLMGALKFDNQLGDNLALQTTVHYRNIQDNNVLNFFDPFGFDPDNNILRVNGFEADRETDVFYVEPQLTWEVGNHSLIFGLNYEEVELTETDWWTGQFGFNDETFEFYFYEINIDFTTGEILNLDNPFFLNRNETYRGNSTNTFTSAYIQDEWRLSDKVTLTLGARFDNFERDADIDSDVDFDGIIDDNPVISDDESHVSPKAALMVRWAPEFNTYFSYGEGFNSNFGAVWQWDPSLYERGTDVEPSVVRNFEVGAKGRVSDRFVYSVAAYNLIQEDRLVFLSTEFGSLRATTADEFESQGLEVETQFRFGSGWGGFANASVIDAEWNDYTVGGVDYTGNEPVGVPDLTYSVGIDGLLMDGLSGRVWFDYVDDYFVTLDNAVQGGGRELLNLALIWDIPSIDARITATGKNLTDEEYYDLFGSNRALTAQPGLPAQFLLNVSFDF